jgi:HAMP domain-containing protein
MVMLSLDARVLMDPVVHIIPGSPGGQIGWPAFSSGTYGFIWDDQGWLIAHPLLSRLRGLNSQGQLPSAGENQAWGALKQEQATVPYNMVLSKYLPQQPFMYHQVQQQQVGSVQGQNAGGVQRVYVYAPILFDASNTGSSQVFGGVGIGTFLNTFYGPATQASTAINNRVNELLRATSGIGGLTLIFTVLLAALVSLSVTRPLAQLARASHDMGTGKLNLTSLDTIADQPLEDEVTELAHSFKWMAEQVQQREQKLRDEVAELHIQIDLQQQERQVEEITGSDWFQYLSQNAKSMRSRYRTANGPAPGTADTPSESAPDQAK